MKRFFFLLLVASLLLAVAAASQRPRYGGTLRLEVSAPPPTLPIAPGAAPDPTAARLSPLIYETLVTLAPNGSPQPALAIHWSADSSFTRWQFQLRPEVRFHSGHEFTAVAAAESLRASGIESIAAVSATGDQLFFTSPSPLPQLPLLLSQPRFAIAEPQSGAHPAGTGPFRIAPSSPPQHLLLQANDDYWAGRPYLDSVDIAFSRSPRQQLLDLELGSTDVAELSLADLAAHPQNLNLVTSQPSLLVALIFDPMRPPSESQRRALAASLGRDSIWSVLLQRSGAPSAALLPQWLSGYNFLFAAPAAQRSSNASPDQFSVRRDEQGSAAFAQPVQSPQPYLHLAAFDQSSASRQLLLEYDFSSPLMQSIASRIAVNARSAGIDLQVVGEPFPPPPGRANLYLVELPLTSSEPHLALSGLLDRAAIFNPALRPDLAAIWRAQSPEQLYALEKSLLASGEIVPIAHIPQTYGLSPRVKDWPASALPEFPLADVWLQGAPANHAPAPPSSEPAP